MEGIKRYFYIVLGFIGIMLAGITFICILIQFKLDASLPMTFFCVSSWLLYLFAVFQTLNAYREAEEPENERTSHDPADPVPNRKFDPEKGDNMLKKNKLYSILVILLLLFTAMFPTAAFAQDASSDPEFTVDAASGKCHGYDPGEIAYRHLTELSDTIGPRVAGSESESDARDYIYQEFKKLGYKTTVQDFTFTRKGVEYDSANVVAVKPGKSSKTVIVGGHYDSVSVGRGADDSASGIAVILETAEVLKKIKTPYTIRFIAFGAEEVGLKGSAYYASQMSEKEIKNTVVMINLDSLAVGDKMYVYGDEGENGWVRDQALKIAKKLKLSLETNPGLNPEYPAGTTGLWSDHAAFVEKGIPYGYFEATNWEIGELDGYTQTVKDGEIWHTEKDTISYIEENYPGRLEEHLSTFSQVLTNLLKNMNQPGKKN